MNTEERESTYRDRLAEAILRAGDGESVGPQTAADAVLAVPNPELDRLTEENTRLAKDIDDLVAEGITTRAGLITARADLVRAETENTRLAAKVTEYEQYETDVRRILNTKSEALGRAEAQLAEAKKKNEDLLSSVAAIARRLRSWINDPKATVTHAGAIVSDLEALTKINPPPGDTPEPNRSEP